MPLKCAKCGYDNQDDALSCNLCQEVLKKQAKKPEDALAALSPAGSAEQRNNQGQMLLGRDAVAQALVEFREAVRLEPGSVIFRCNLASALSRSGDAAGALREYEECLRLAPRDWHTHFNLGNLHFRLKQYELACASYESAVEIEPDRPEAHFGLGKSLQRLKLWERAVPCLEQALALAPEHPLADEAHLLCGVHYSSAGAPEPAEKHLQAALKLSPNFFMAHFSLAELYLGQKRLPQALLHAQKACALEPEDADAAQLLKDILAASGQA